MTKEFKRLDEQLDILESRGLIISDRDGAKDFLFHNNYYRVSGYSLTLRNHDVFYPGASFQNIMDIYNFDMELRNILLSALEIIEVNIKSIYAYTFSREFGGLGYLDSNHFCDSEKYKTIMSNGDKQTQRRLMHEAYLQHYIQDLGEPLPLWAFVDLLTIADISILYSITDPKIKENIACNYGFKFKDGSYILGNHLHSMTILRNLCAHGSRLYNRLFITKPSLNKKEKKLLRQTEKGEIDNSKLFGFILVVKRLLNEKEFSDVKNKLLSLCKKYPFVNMRYYGFCDNWENLI